jgi:hypothetical protein
MYTNTKAIEISDHVMIVKVFDNYAGPYVHLLGLQDRATNCPDYPFWCQTLSVLLTTKRVLCISSFADTMREQARSLGQIHNNRWSFNVDNLSFYRCAQSIAFSSELGWEQNFEGMVKEIDRLDFDIALLAAGGYGHPLITHIARGGRSAIYCGAVLQTVFGIRGGRFDATMADVINEHWKRPSKDETPERYTEVEGGCYW